MSNFVVLHQLLEKEVPKKKLKTGSSSDSLSSVSAPDIKAEDVENISNISNVSLKTKDNSLLNQSQELLKGKDAVSDIIKSMAIVYHCKLEENINLQREFLFLCMYYGIIKPAMTLEAIGKSQGKTHAWNSLTRERVKQIVDLGVSIIKENFTHNNSSFNKSHSLVAELLDQKKTSFITIDDVLKLKYFQSFCDNTKGLIAFLNDCGVKQIAYRKEYYFYLSTGSRKNIIKEIQKQNKEVRKEQTAANMAKKSKTVTYVPSEIKNYLNQQSESLSMGLNELYELIFVSFIHHNPYEQMAYIFPKTKSWKARQGTAQWEQIGIYMDKELFENVKTIVKKLKKAQRAVSLMSFFCQAFTWYYENERAKKQ